MTSSLGSLRLSFAIGLIGLAVATPFGHAQTPFISQSHWQHSEPRDVVGTIPAFMLSDIHFDPFSAPDRVKRLIHSQIRDWDAILAPPITPLERQDFAALQQRCGAHGIDTPYSLLRSSLDQMREREPAAKFIMVGGDLIAHSFDCKFKALFPTSSQNDYQNFVIETITFVMVEFQGSFPRIPAYLALGNNDTPCGDYHLDTGSSFLSKTGTVIAAGLPPAERQQVANEFGAGGYYSVSMGTSLLNTRLIVINDIFMSSRYVACSGRLDSATANGQMEWLRSQLTEARQHGEKIWLMGHISPGVDILSTLTQFKDVCGGDGPAMFLSSDKLADLLIEYGDIVRLVVFGHTHMDEMRLLQPGPGTSQNPAEHSLPVKLIPSISPFDGNNPSFTIAHVNPTSSLLQDYEVISSKTKSGSGNWVREYGYNETYHQVSFSAQAVAQLIAGFRNDSTASSEGSQQYIRYYFVGDFPELKPFWPQYVCALANHTAKEFARCVCSAGP